MRIRRLASVGFLLLVSSSCSDDPASAALADPGAGSGGAPAAGSGASGKGGSGGKGGQGGSAGSSSGGAGAGGAGAGGATAAGGSAGASAQAGASGAGGEGGGSSGSSGQGGAGGSAGGSGGQGGSAGAGGSGGKAGGGGAGAAGSAGGGSAGQGGAAGSSASGPAWWQKAPVGGFVEIPGTNNCGVVANAYSGFTLKLDSAELFFLAVGGHGDSSDNRVVSLALLDDAPAWKLRNPPSTHPIKDAGYYDDGDGTPKKPGSTHTYDYTAWVPQAAGGAGRLMRFAMHGTWPNGGDAFNVDGFDPVTNTWDPPGTYPDLVGNAGTAVDRDTGTVYSVSGTKRLTVGSKQWEDAPLHTVRFPNAWDSQRHAFFGLQWADGQGYGPPGLTVVLNTPQAKNSQPLKLVPSEALTQLLADKPAYAGMDYDPILDKYLFYAGQDSAQNKTPERIYVITPNSNPEAWTIDFFKLAPGSAKLTPVVGAGVQGRFKYVAQLRGFVYLPEQTANLFFLRTAE